MPYFRAGIGRSAVTFVGTDGKQTVLIRNEILDLAILGLWTSKHILVLVRTPLIQRELHSRQGDAVIVLIHFMEVQLIGVGTGLGFINLNRRLSARGGNSFHGCAVPDDVVMVAQLAGITIPIRNNQRGLIRKRECQDILAIAITGVFVCIRVLIQW